MTDMLNDEQFYTKKKILKHWYKILFHVTMILYYLQILPIVFATTIFLDKSHNSTAWYIHHRFFLCARRVEKTNIFDANDKLLKDSKKTIFKYLYNIVSINRTYRYYIRRTTHLFVLLVFKHKNCLNQKQYTSENS